MISQLDGLPVGYCAEFAAIHEAIAPHRLFVEVVEADNATLQRMHAMRRELQSQWNAMADRGNRFAKIFLRNVEERFTATADGARCELAWFLTRDGHAHAAQFIPFLKREPADLPAAQRDEMPAFSASLRRVKAKLLDDAKVVMPTAKGSDLASEFVLYLQTPTPFGETESEFDVWPDLRLNATTATGKLLATFATVITQLPASEAAAERLFSIFQCLFDSRRLSSGIDLIEADMIIRMWQVYHPRELELPLP